MHRDSVRPVIVIVLVWLAASAIGLGTTSLWEPDEPRFAEATRQMLLRGDFLTPYFNGVPRFEKPILFYWMQLPTFVVLGPTETAARLPAAVTGLGCLLLTYAIGRRYFSDRAALAASLVLATTFRFAVWTRQGLTDVPVLCWMLAALYCFLRAVEDERPRGMALLGWMAIGLGALTKGPVIVLPLLVLGGYLVWSKQLASLGRLRPITGGVIAAAIAVPWYAWMAWLHGRAFVNFALGYEVIARYGYSATEFPSAPRSFAWYLQIYPGDAAPWTLFILVGMGCALWRWRTLDVRTARGVALACIWFAVVFVVFSSARFKVPHYILPAYPAAALLTGLFLDRAFDRARPGWLWHVPAALTGTLAAAFGGLIALFLHRVFRTPWIDVGMFVPVAIGGGGLGMLALSALGRRAEAFYALVGGLALATAVLAIYTAPHDLQRYQPIRALGTRVAQIAGPDDRVAIYGRLGGPGLIFYGRHDVEWIDDPARASQFLAGSGRRFCVIPERDLMLVRQVHPAPLTVVERGTFFNVRLKQLFDEHQTADERPMLLVTNQAP
jgi:4-amino-4-deoxy-L-arabinose transferase-like glycosyltransferase